MVATSRRPRWLAKRSQTERRRPVSRRCASIVVLTNITAGSRPSPMRPAKAACSFKWNVITETFRQERARELESKRVGEVPSTFIILALIPPPRRHMSAGTKERSAGTKERVQGELGENVVAIKRC